jgi:cysteinylglycine-S-conjugate dipeptidase
MDGATIRERIAADMPRITEELSRLVAIPSVGLPGYDPANVRASAVATRDILVAAGVADAHLLELDGGHPAVVGKIQGPDGAPTVLLYAHHDVQPEGPAAEWTSPPFEPMERDGRLFGRGSADNKSGVVVHAAALRALGVPQGSTLPVTVKILVEGEEECSTEHLPMLVGQHAEHLRADVALIADGGLYRNGVPMLSSSMRGVTDCIVSVSVLRQAVHSGSYGGAIPDALSALCRMLASLHDEQGDVAIAGLDSSSWTGIPVDPAEFRGEAGVLAGVELIGTGQLADRLITRPAVSVLGIDAPSVAESSNQLVPRARARVSLRLAPGQDPPTARDALIAHLRAAAPWGVQVEIEAGEAGAGYIVDRNASAYVKAKRALSQAWDHEVVETGDGGSIPLVAMMAEAFPGIGVLICGASDEKSNTHSLDESVDMSQVGLLAVAEALLIQDLGST